MESDNRFPAVHNIDMRTRANVNLDNDAYSVATAFAAARGIALGAAISELIRHTEQAPELPLERIAETQAGSARHSDCESRRPGHHF